MEWKILRKKGWKLNPNDDLVNSIISAINRCNGHCPCAHPNRRGHDQCPCSEYNTYDNCFCGLYVKEDTNEEM